MRNTRSVCLFLHCASGWAACGGGGLSPNGDFATHDLAGQDLAGRDLVSTPADLASIDQSNTPLDFAGVDLIGRTCFTGECTKPNCGTNCCASGEWCDNGTCRCGNGNACTGGNICATGAIIDGNGCGTICCGHGSACPG